MRTTLSRSVILASVIAAIAAAAAAFAENVDPGNTPIGAQFAWGENVGWINAEPANGIPPVPLAQGVTVSGSKVTGYMYGENIGWINMHCSNNGTCGSTGNYGVTNDGLGNLGGYAWGENVGWISFSCTNSAVVGHCASVGNYGVDINPITGEWTGDAWGENIGWINFDHSQTGSRVVTFDQDSIAQANDNCPFDANDAQTNTDFANTGISFPGADAFGDACDADDDGDGCSDAEETSGSGNAAFGGGRNPLFVWDFYDVTDVTPGENDVDLQDALAILVHFGHGPATDPADNRLDREPGAASYAPKEAVSPAHLGIDVQDVLVNLQSFGHSCSAPG